MFMRGAWEGSVYTDNLNVSNIQYCLLFSLIRLLKKRKIKNLGYIRHVCNVIYIISLPPIGFEILFLVKNIRYRKILSLAMFCDLRKTILHSFFCIWIRSRPFLSRKYMYNKEYTWPLLFPGHLSSMMRLNHIEITRDYIQQFFKYTGTSFFFFFLLKLPAKL